MNTFTFHIGLYSALYKIVRACADSEENESKNKTLLSEISFIISYLLYAFGYVSLETYHYAATPWIVVLFSTMFHIFTKNLLLK